jgi:predicted Holliday junction resolvase-like endonuclease|tara:strand:+ start:372 stop:611 length:240 start_codon:yes stop_codon:yes gene_type:complete
MEITTAYIFGVLTVVAITLVIVIVIGIVKILKQQRMIQRNSKDIESNNLEFNRCINEVYQHTDSRVDKLEAKLTTKINK